MSTSVEKVTQSMAENKSMAEKATKSVSEKATKFISNPANMSTSVEKVTQSMADTSIQPAADDGAHSISAAEGRRLYIGNLSYSTTEAELKEFFKNFKVESVSIPTNPRTSRAVGYAFVDVSTKEEAEKAITELSGKEVLERKVSVQVARRPTIGAASPEGGNGERGGRRGGGRGGRGGTRGGRGDRGERGDRGGRDSAGARGKRPPRKDSEGAPKEGEAAPAAAAESTNSAAGSDDKENIATTARPKKKKGPPENGVPSTTKVMVANLPYELSEEKLKELFSAYEPESAKIALRPIPRFMIRKLQERGEARKGRGFGFVTLSSEDMQKKAVEEMNGKVVEGREIAVKVAIDNPKLEGEEGEEGGEEGTYGAKETPAAAAYAE